MAVCMGWAGDLLDRVDVVLDDRVHERLVEAMCGSDENVQFCVFQDQRAALGERVEQVVRFVLLAGLFLSRQRELSPLEL